MKIVATVGYAIHVSFNSNTNDLNKIKKRVIEESDKIFIRQFSKGQIIWSNVDICDKELVVIRNGELVDEE